MTIQRKAILEEIKRRQDKKAAAAAAPSLILEEFCFDKQLLFIKDPNKFKSAVCSRRAGKTVACAADLLDTIMSHKDVNCLYLTLNRMSAKRIIWKDLLKIIKKYKLNVKVNASDLTITCLDTDSTLYISGAKDATEIEKFRGMALKKVYIDECQSFRNYLRDLIDDVIIPALWDHDGTLVLIGTPGPICAGVFYESCVSSEWSPHHWTIHDNPWILKLSGKTPDEILKIDRERKGVSEDNPSYRREGLGEWVEDMDALVFKYKREINDYNTLPEGDYEYVMGVDIGYNDADAIAVMAYNHKQNKVYLVEEYVKPKQTISQLATAIRRIDSVYNCSKKVIDAGALGKKIQEEIVQRYRINLEPAEKTRKIEFIEYMNADLRKGFIKIKADTVFAEESKLMTWDYDKSTPDRLVVSKAYHSDICDAVLYAYREARHWWQEKDHVSPLRHTQEYMDQLEQKEADAMEAKSQGNDFDLSDADCKEFESLVWGDEF